MTPTGGERPDGAVFLHQPQAGGWLGIHPAIKRPPGFPAAFFEMERAKRLELIVVLLQICLGKEAYESLTTPDAYRRTHAKSGVFDHDKLNTWAAQLDEIIVTWPSIETNIQHGLMALVRSQKPLAPRL